MQTIKGKVTRIVSERNFFFVPDDDQAGHRFHNLEGHRVGAAGELSYQCHPDELARGNDPKFELSGPMPTKVGQPIEVRLGSAAGQGGRAGAAPVQRLTAEQVAAEAAARLDAEQTHRDNEDRVGAEMDRLRRARAAGAGEGGQGGGAAS